MRVDIVTREYPPEIYGGAGVHVTELVRALRRSVDVRAVLNGVLYVLETGCQWRHRPKDFPPRSTCHTNAVKF